MSLFLVVQEAKIYRQFYVRAEGPVQAKTLVENYGDSLPHSTDLMQDEKEIVEIWMEEATVPVWQAGVSEDGSPRERQPREKGHGLP